MSCVLRKKGESNNCMYVKGAPEMMIKSASTFMNQNGDIKVLTENDKAQLNDRVIAMASKGLRVLGLSVKYDCGDLNDYNGLSDVNHRAHDRLSDPDSYSEFEKGSTLVGFVGLKDPIRLEVVDAIKRCRTAGIVVFMVTGDIVHTAKSIAEEIGLIPFNTKEVEKYCITGNDFEDLEEHQKHAFINHAFATGTGLVFARTAPKHKRQLVKILKEMGGIVAMTGDGVNDAPALQQADIGIAMGITGTDVAKEASQMILADDNFATIVDAVEEGRAIYDNMKAFIRYMISSNIGEVISIFLSAVIGIPDGFNSIQLLWVNLVTDGLPATALSFNPPDCEIMLKPPRNR